MKPVPYSPAMVAATGMYLISGTAFPNTLHPKTSRRCSKRYAVRAPAITENPRQLWLCGRFPPQTYAQQGLAGSALDATLSHFLAYIFK